MDCPDYIIVEPERKPGQHLQREDRGAIQRLHHLGFSNRTIARELHCPPTTIGNELGRGTRPRKSNKGRAPGYSAKRGQAVYQSNRSRCHKPHKAAHCSTFLDWVARQVREHRWSLDACVGYARLHRLFKESKMTRTKTLYNEPWRGGLPLTPFEVPDALKRRHANAKGHADKRSKGRSIDERPVEVSTRTVMGHWEADTVVGLRNGKEAVVFTLVERVTDNYIAMQIPGRTSESVQTAIRMLRTEYGDHFSDVFKTITADNGPEFENSLRPSSGVQRFTLHIRIRLGSGLSTSATTVCCEALSRKGHPLKSIPRHRSSPFLTN